MANLYWSIYKNLEYEVLNLAKLIHFDDKQLSVYSVRIADLLIRCAVEIEAISKELYEKNGGSMIDEDGKEKQLFFDTDCLDFLESKWTLGKKNVLIVGTDTYFENEVSRTLAPLFKANLRGKCDWKKAYQAVKHDRGKNLQKASVKNLLSALAALFLLNVYYKANNAVFLNKVQKLSDVNFGSKMFEIKTSICTFEFPNKGCSLDEECICATYIIKQTEDSYGKYYNEVKIGFDKQLSLLYDNGYERVENEDGELEDVDYADVYKIAAELGGSVLVQKILSAETKSKAINFLCYEAILNKSSRISFNL